MSHTKHESDDATVHHRSARERRRRQRGPAAVGELNLTSMIDVIFQLLIYFVVTASFMIDEGVLTAMLPQGPGSPAPPDELPQQTIVIELTSSRDDPAVVGIAWDPRQTTADFAQLAAQLDLERHDPEKGRFGGTYAPDNPIEIQPDGEVRWQHVVDAFNAAIAAEYTNVRFAPAAAGS
ncbi:MAG: biopolymer transporter ExbD [Planctomycetota bacterium]